MAFNPKFTLVSIGNMQGVVHTFDIVLQDSGPMAVFSHSMVLKMPGHKSAPIKLSAVSCLNWTCDGNALAVAWAYGGLSVWSVFGSLLMSTVSEDTFAKSSYDIIYEGTASSQTLMTHSLRVCRIW